MLLITIVVDFTGLLLTYNSTLVPKYNTQYYMMYVLCIFHKK